MKNVLVTGGAGFIGSHLCDRLLALGCKVINLDNFNDSYAPAAKHKNIKTALANPNYTLYPGDILDPVLIEQIWSKHEIDTVIHLAALAGVRKSLAAPLEYIDVDIKGTVHLLDTCKQHAVKKFIFASSSSIYGNSPVPFTEDHFSSPPLSPYAVSKLSGELFCKTYHLLYKLPVVCLRFFTVYGPRQRPEMAIHNFTKLIDQGFEIPIFGNGKSMRDYTYIDDIIDGIIGAMDLKSGFEIINLGNSNPITLNQLINTLESKLGKPAIKRYMKRQPGDAENTWADISKAESMLGFSPKVSIHQGIEKFLDWYMATKN